MSACERAGRRRNQKIRSRCFHAEPLFCHVIKYIFNCPDVVVASDRDSTSVCAIECAGTIVNRDVDIGKPGRRYNPRIEPHLARHPLWLLLAIQGLQHSSKRRVLETNLQSDFVETCAVALSRCQNAIDRQARPVNRCPLPIQTDVELKAGPSGTSSMPLAFTWLLHPLRDRIRPTKTRIGVGLCCSRDPCNFLLGQLKTNRTRVSTISDRRISTSNRPTESRIGPAGIDARYPLSLALATP